jgi:hypothetical protein
MQMQMPSKWQAKKIVLEKKGYVNVRRNKTILIFFYTKKGIFLFIIFLDEFDRNKTDNL